MRPAPREDWTGFAESFTFPVPGRTYTKTVYFCGRGHEHRTRAAAERCSTDLQASIDKARTEDRP